MFYILWFFLSLLIFIIIRVHFKNFVMIELIELRDSRIYKYTYMSVNYRLKHYVVTMALLYYSRYNIDTAPVEG